MQSSLVVTLPADDLSLLTIEELREAAGVTGEDDDDQLTAIGLQVAALIAAQCNVEPGIGSVPTLRQEQITETFWNVCTSRLILGRQHEVDVFSIVDGGSTLSAADYIINPVGSIIRLTGDAPSYWGSTKTVVVYNAGFETVPDDLKAVASEMVKQAWVNANSTVATGVKAQTVRVYDIEEIRTEYFEGTSSSSSGNSSGAVPDSVAGKLARFRNMAIV